MLLEIPRIFLEIGYYTGAHLILFFIEISLFFISAILFINKSFKVDAKDTKQGYIAYGLFFIFFALKALCYFSGFLFENNYDLIITFGYIFVLLSIIFILYVLETQIIVFTRKALTLITIGLLIICIISLIGITSRYFALQLLTTIPIILVIGIASVYIYVLIKSSGEVRKKAFFIFLGILLMYLSELLDSELFFNTFPSCPIVIVPLTMIVGILIFTYFNLFYKIK